jgi:hypothetical protein
MRIPVTIGNQQYFITSDSNQYMIAEAKSKNGKASLEGKWFYSSLASLFTALLHKKVRASDATTLQELRAAIQTAEKELLDTFDFNSKADALAVSC